MKVAQLRIEHGVTQQELADATGMHVRTIQELERGWVQNPKIRSLVNIAAALGVKLEDVCEDEWLVPRKLFPYQGRHNSKLPPQGIEKLKKQPGRFEEG